MSGATQVTAMMVLTPPPETAPRVALRQVSSSLPGSSLNVLADAALAPPPQQPLVAPDIDAVESAPVKQQDPDAPNASQQQHRSRLVVKGSLKKVPNKPDALVVKFQDGHVSGCPVKCLENAPGKRYRPKKGRINASYCIKSLRSPDFTITREDGADMVRMRTKKYDYLVLHDKNYVIASTQHGKVVSAMLVTPNTYKRAGHTFRTFEVQSM